MDTRERAERARAILEDVLFVEAIQSIRERHLAAFESSAPENSDVREQAYHALKAITELKSQLQDAISDEAIKKGRHRGSD